MIGDFKILGKENYIQINNQGTLEKLPKLKWWWVLYFVIKNHIKGEIHINEFDKFKKRKD